MLMQQFVYSPDALALLSKRESDSATLPTTDVKKLIAAKTMLAGFKCARYIAMCKYDLAMHGASPPTTAEELTAMWQQLHQERVGIATHASTTGEQTHFASTWYHMAIGYDCAYYGYMWSESIALDGFERFRLGGGDDEEKEARLDAVVGKALRREILAPGARVEEGAMVRGFLGREPNDAAFLRSIGAG